MSETAPFVDAHKVRRNFARAAAAYDEAAVLQREVASRMLERLDYVKIAPQRVLDIGCGTGGSLAALGERYPKAFVLGADACEAMLLSGRGQRKRMRLLLPFMRGNSASLLSADTQALPLKTAAVGLIWSNLMLHWVDAPLAAFRELHRVLDVGGLLMFSTFGPDTLKELRACFSDGCEHTHRFVDMHDYGDMLVESGFADPVMDVEMLTMTYPSVDELFSDLRRNGANCAMFERRRGLMGRQTWQAARAAYAKLLKDDRLPATFEVVYGHAWKAQPTKTADGRAIVRFDPKQRLR